MTPQYPSILTRYLSTLIDGLFILLMVIITSFIFQEQTKLIEAVRVVIILTMFLIYEPLCTSIFCTLGQKIMGIRVRRIDTFDKIPIHFAYLRILTKIFLGFISFFTVMFSKNKRAIHDFAGKSVVICNE